MRECVVFCLTCMDIAGSAKPHHVRERCREMEVLLSTTCSIRSIIIVVHTTTKKKCKKDVCRDQLLLDITYPLRYNHNNLKNHIQTMPPLNNTSQHPQSSLSVFDAPSSHPFPFFTGGAVCVTPSSWLLRLRLLTRPLTDVDVDVDDGVVARLSLSVDVVDPRLGIGC